LAYSWLPVVVSNIQVVLRVQSDITATIMKTLTIIAIYMLIGAGSTMAQAPVTAPSGKYRTVEPITFLIEKGKPITHQVQPTAIRPVLPPVTEQTVTGQLKKEEENKMEKAIASKQ